MSIQLKLRTECTMFFEENPFMFETVEGLADRLGRKAEHLYPVIQQLVELSILSEIGTAERPLYRYKQPDSIIIR